MNPRCLFLGITVEHQRFRVVDQHRLRDAAEVTERPGESLAPVVVALTQKGLNVFAPRIAEHGDEQHHARALLSDPNPLLAEVDLELVARRRLKSNGRDLGGPLRVAMRTDDALNGPRMDLDAALGEQVRDDDGIALSRRLEQLHRLGAQRVAQGASSRPRLRLRSDAAMHVPLGGLACDAELASDASAAPA
jgi:hypothetical protein